MSAADFPERLKRARMARGIGSYALSRMIGMTGSYVSMIETRARLRDAFPAADVLARMAESLQVPSAYLLGRAPWPSDASQQVAEARARYLIEALPALLDRLSVAVVDDPLGGMEDFGGSLGDPDRRTLLPQDIEYTLPKHQRGRRGKRYRAIIAHGQCMGDTIKDGWIVLFEDSGHAEPGELVVAVLDDEQITVKRLVQEGGLRFLVSEQGHRYPVDGAVRLVGPVRLVLQRF